MNDPKLQKAIEVLTEARKVSSAAVRVVELRQKDLVEAQKVMTVAMHNEADAQRAVMAAVDGLAGPQAGFDMLSNAYYAGR